MPPRRAAPKPSLRVQAHESRLSCLALNADGSRVATASEKGTLIRVFHTTTGAKVAELRRGVDHCLIRRLRACVSLSAAHRARRLTWRVPGPVCASTWRRRAWPSRVTRARSTCLCWTNKRTAPRRASGAAPVPFARLLVHALTPGSGGHCRLAFLGNVVTYLASEWSFAQFTLTATHAVAAFGAGEDRDTLLGTCAAWGSGAAERSDGCGWRAHTQWSVAMGRTTSSALTLPRAPVHGTHSTRF
jgi:WD repeat-containing protein 45